MTPAALRSARHSLGWSIDRMAAALHIGRSTYIRYEQGQAKPVGYLGLAVERILDLNGE
jgi:transcriptional regulator with XRE-family HTH domain